MFQSNYEQPMDDMSCIIENGSIGSVYLGNIESACNSFHKYSSQLGQFASPQNKRSFIHMHE